MCSGSFFLGLRLGIDLFPGGLFQFFRRDVDDVAEKKGSPVVRLHEHVEFNRFKVFLQTYDDVSGSRAFPFVNGLAVQIDRGFAGHVSEAERPAVFPDRRGKIETRIIADPVPRLDGKCFPGGRGGELVQLVAGFLREHDRLGRGRLGRAPVVDRDLLVRESRDDGKRFRGNGADGAGSGFESFAFRRDLDDVLGGGSGLDDDLRIAVEERAGIRLFAEDAGRIAVADADITAARDTRSRFSGNGP